MTLLSLFNDLYYSLNNNKNTQLKLFDLSSAFDIVDHDILIDRLKIIWLKGTLINDSVTILQTGNILFKLKIPYYSHRLKSNTGYHNDRCYHQFYSPSTLYQ